MNTIPSQLKIKNIPFPAGIFLESAANLSITGSGASASSTPPTTAAPKLEITLSEAQIQAVLSLAISAWRIKKRITDVSTKKLKEEFTHDDARKINRYVESISESLEQLGIATIDRTGEVHDDGFPERVITAKPQVGLPKEIITETLRPTIQWNDKLFPGEIEILRPAKPDETIS